MATFGIKRLRIVCSSVLASLAMGSLALATNSWNGFHWARTANPFTLKVGDRVTSVWDARLDETIGDWSQSTMLDLVKIPNLSTSKNACKATSGRIDVCNAKYGANGWLGIAQVWVSGGHITQGLAKMNDTYFDTPTYNKTEWRNLVMCQEVGHLLGLDHSDETFDNPNQGTCMDYTNNPGTNQHPNQHDYDMLVQIYTHLDAFSTVNTSSSSSKGNDVDLDDPRAWGRLVSQSRGGAVYERDFGNGEKMLTHVTFVPGEERGPNR
jgi:hypothetical protein